MCRLGTDESQHLQGKTPLQADSVDEESLGHMKKRLVPRLFHSSEFLLCVRVEKKKQHKAEHKTFGSHVSVRRTTRSKRRPDGAVVGGLVGSPICPGEFICADDASGLAQSSSLLQCQ